MCMYICIYESTYMCVCYEHVLYMCIFMFLKTNARLFYNICTIYVYLSMVHMYMYVKVYAYLLFIKHYILFTPALLTKIANIERIV